MRDEDREVVAWLRDVVDGPAPSARTGLDEVVARGRRRLRWIRAGGAVGVVVAVVAVGVAASGLAGRDLARPLPPAGGAASTTSTVAGTATAAAGPDWPRASLPARKPDGTWSTGMSAPPPSGRPVIHKEWCSSGVPDDVLSSFGPERIGDEQLASFVSVVRSAGVPLQVSPPRREDLPPPSRPGGRPAYAVEVDLTDAEGTGSLAMQASRVSEEPLVAADRHAFGDRNCQPPFRKVLPDGTVLQMYEATPTEPFQSLRQLAVIYRPGGRTYTLTVRSWGSGDVRPDPSEPGTVVRFGPGRATLPLSDAGLARIAEELAARLR
ncbi:hypothetical protein LX15_004251 [Streptoalloteichus tenebrarius]|uniref:LigA protein n=1 Tax=Streptoalloteichus tenebrarius (strain ATCC 17920 / DSM 40477 / JCM 4838 / CBS 697.72 / NBRC 16177 / NCIMB 11028 / NRRL B-12390 / A12253. 1 / ISP 5477) TaxID=1933 RepID=A0ABT1HYC8_STRSD|nr:hypothetical protein [Streptoalloteichus tenebrarius]MCP2260533.1 hypothetical protein [Streptoalloteichus tenebrarius]BFF01873.1 hypothetical protein GCM10020241_35480 [Streptoalloteichus tenebrarius]